ncbi:MAG: glycine cleavage system protein GcvH [Chloroflexi bacterium]|nr:glycine cleavage system protein GcvH [Chloroflexota bacterium]
MSQVPEDLRYTKEDEWLRVDGDELVLGVTDYAQDSLSDIVYLELPDAGDSFDAGDAFGVIESVKAAADLFMPIAGEITAANEDLMDTPELVNEDPYGEAWLVRFKPTNMADINDLMDADTYEVHLAERD